MRIDLKNNIYNRNSTLSVNKNFSGCAFGALLKYQDGVITYIVDSDDKNKEKPLKIEKVIDGKNYNVKTSLLEFCQCLYKVGLLKDFIPLYKKYKQENLPQLLESVNENLTKTELENLVKLIHSPNKAVLSYYIPQDGLVSSVKNSDSEKLTVGKIKSLTPKTVSQITKHISSLGISHTTGGISGLHDIDIYNQIYEITSKYPGRKVHVTEIISPEDKNIMAIAQMPKDNTDQVFLEVIHNDELYSKRINSKRNAIPTNIRLRRIIDENGNETFKYYVSMLIDEDDKDSVNSFWDTIFDQKEKGENLKFPGMNYRIAKIGGKKYKISISKEQNGIPTEIAFDVTADGNTKIHFIERLILDNKKMYFQNIPIGSPFKKTFETEDKSFKGPFEKYMSMFHEIKTEKDMMKLLFDSHFEKEEKISHNASYETLDFYSGVDYKNEERVQLAVNHDLYIIERKNLPNGLSIFKYTYGYALASPTEKKTKTVISKDIMKEVLSRISKKDFNAAYKIDKSGKIFAYFKYKEIFFKLILSDVSNSTCFPLTSNDVEEELGNMFKDIPSLD